MKVTITGTQPLALPAGASSSPSGSSDDASWPTSPIGATEGLSTVSDGTTTVNPTSSVTVPLGGVVDNGSGEAALRFVPQVNGGIEAAPVVADATSAYEIDWATLNAVDLTLTTACTITFANVPTLSGEIAGIVVILRGDYAVTWPGAVTELNADPGGDIRMATVYTGDGTTFSAVYFPAWAAAVVYDNSSSGLTADNVQDAIDEVAASGGGDLPSYTADADTNVEITAGDGSTGEDGANIYLSGGDGPSGQAGGSVQLYAGTGDDGSDAPASIGVFGGDGAGNAGKVSITTDGSTGTSGQVLTSDGTYGTWEDATGGGGTPASTVESETTFGISAAVGTDTEYARQDHTHGSPADPTSGYGDIVTHDASEFATPGDIPSGGTPSLTLGTTNAAGSASTYVKTDATVAAFDATAPSTQAFGDSAAAGSAGKAARRDHKHAMPSDPTSGYGDIVTHDASEFSAPITDIVNLPTSETDDTLVLAPDGVGGVEFRAESGGGGGDLPVYTAPTGTDVVITAGAGSSSGGADAQLIAGDGDTGESGGDVTIRSGAGDDGSTDGSAVIVFGGSGSDPGSVAVYSNGSFGGSGQVLTSGGFTAAWEDPPIPTFHGCSVYKSTNYATGSTGDHPILCNSENFDTDGYHSTSTNTSRITIPTGLDGYYRFWGGGLQSAGTANYLAIKISNTTLKAVQGFINAQPYQTISSPPIYMAAGAYAELIVNGNCTISANAYSLQFSCELLGA